MTGRLKKFVPSFIPMFEDRDVRGWGGELSLPSQENGAGILGDPNLAVKIGNLHAAGIAAPWAHGTVHRRPVWAAGCKWVGVASNLNWLLSRHGKDQSISVGSTDL